MLGLLVSAASPPNYPRSTSSHSQAPAEILYRFDYVEQILKFQNEFGQKLRGHPAGKTWNAGATWQELDIAKFVSGTFVHAALQEASQAEVAGLESLGHKVFCHEKEACVAASLERFWF